MLRHVIVSEDGSEYTLGRDEVIDDYIVPKDFKWNGASVPWFATPIIPKAYKTLEASCLHDWLCADAETPVEREAADRAFIEVLRGKGFNKVRLKLGYWGVRLGAFFGIGVKYKHWADPIKRATRAAFGSLMLCRKG